MVFLHHGSVCDQTTKILSFIALITVMRIIIENNENHKQTQIKSGCITVMRIWKGNVLNYEHNVTMQNILMVL